MQKSQIICSIATIIVMIALIMPSRCYAQAALNARRDKLWVEVDLILNPATGLQKSGNYKLNGTPIMPSETYFYAVQNTTHPFANITSTFDQANAIYLLYETNRRTNGWLANTAFVFGITHDKLQTDPGTLAPNIFRYDWGGLELTLGLKRRKRISNILDAYLGFQSKFVCIASYELMYFKSFNNIDAYVVTPQGDSLRTVKKEGVFTIQDRSFATGYGFMANTSLDFGYAVSDRLQLTIGGKIMTEFHHNNVKVSKNGFGENKLTTNIFGVFLIPTFNICYRFH